METNEQKSARYVFWLLLILAGAFVLRILLLGSKPLWADEGAVWYMALGEVKFDAPYIYPYIFGWSQQLFGWNEFAARFPSALYGWLTVPLVYLLGRDCFDRSIALYAALFAGLSPYLISLSQELRIYSLLGLEIVLTLWLFLNILKRRAVSPVWWIALTLAGIAGQYTHCFFILILVYFVVVALFTESPGRWRLTWRLLAVAGCILAASWPQLSVALSVAGHRPHLIASDLLHLKMNVMQVARAYFSFLFGHFPQVQSEPLSTAESLKGLLKWLMVFLWIMMAVLAAIQVSTSVSGKDFQARTLKILLGLILLSTGLFAVVSVSTAGHLVFIYVPFLLVIVFALKQTSRRVVTILLLLIILFSGFSLYDYYTAPRHHSEDADWRAAGRLLAAEKENRDAVLILGARNIYYTLKFYYPRMDGEVFYRPRHDPGLLGDSRLMHWWRELSPDDKVADLLARHTRVWVVRSQVAWEHGDPIYSLYQNRKWHFGGDLKVSLFSEH